MEHSGTRRRREGARAGDPHRGKGEVDSPQCWNEDELVFKCPDIFPRRHGRGVNSFAALSRPFPYRSDVAVNLNMKTNRLKNPVFKLQYLSFSFLSASKMLVEAKGGSRGKVRTSTARGRCSNFSNSFKAAESSAIY